ncbi:MAG: TRAP transporter substrate-binding protein [Acetobacteraceae bacterium]
MRRLLAALVLTAVTAFSAATAQAAITWDYMAVTGVTHAVTKYQMAFAAEVLKRTNGQLRIIVRPAGELPFRADEAGRAAGEGQVQIAAAYAGFLSGTVPLAGVAGNPFLVRTNDDLEKVWPIMNRYIQPEFEKLGVKVLFRFSWPPQNMFGINKPILTAADFAGRKIRTTDPKQAEMIKRLGGSSITLATAEVPVAMQRGLMEGVLTATFNLVTARWAEMVKWGWYGNINVGGPDFELVNLKAYNALPPDVRKVLDEVAAEWGPKMTQEIAGLEIADKQSLKTKYHIETYDAPQDVVDELAKRMAPYWDEWAQQNGPNGQAMMKEIRTALGK